MKFITVALASLIASTFCLDTAWAGRRTSSSSNSGEVSVNGYYRQNGTYVAPYVRTAPNQTRNDNWSTVGNTNPYTGRQGTQEGDSKNYSYPNFQPSFEPSFQPSFAPQKKCTLTTSDGRTISSAAFCGQ